MPPGRAVRGAAGRPRPSRAGRGRGRQGAGVERAARLGAGGRDRARDHGIVGNGWYLRDLGEVLFWRQHNALVQGEKLWETARRAKPGFKAANVCWWYAMGASTDLTVTPRPIYHADGRKSPDCYTHPAELHDRLTGALGEFPLFQF